MSEYFMPVSTPAVDRRTATPLHDYEESDQQRPNTHAGEIIKTIASELYTLKIITWCWQVDEQSVKTAKDLINNVGILLQVRFIKNNTAGWKLHDVETL